MTDASTTSRPLFNRQQLISLFLPLVAEQALSISIGLADTLMVSSVGEAAVSGVSLVDSFNVLMIQLLSALATGGAVVASQYIGHREPKRAKASAAQIMFIMISLSVVTAVIVAVGRHAILRGIFGSIDADVMRYAETYFLLSALSYPFIGVYNAGAALFRAQGNSKISMLSSLVMNVVNIGGNAILIYGFGMGVMGAATASLVSRMIACFTVMFLLQKPDCALRIDHLTDLKPDLDLIRRILKVGIPAGIENGMFQIGKLSVSSLTSTLGTAAIAANAVAGNISSFLNVPASAVGIGALTVVGQCLGAGERHRPSAIPPAAPDRLRRGLGDEPFRPVLPEQAGALLVQPLAGCLRHGTGADGLVQRCVADPVALQLHLAQHPARRRRCRLYHDGQRCLHVGVPGGLLLPDGAQVPLRPAVHLAGHVPGLGHALAVLLRPLCPRQVDGTKGDLSFRISGPPRHCTFGGEGLFCAGNPHPVSYQ